MAHNAVETVQNSYLDAGIQVSINILVQNISPWGYKDPLSRALHNLMVTYLLTEAHSGYDLPFMSHRLFPVVFGGAPRHELHHQHGNVYFHQFFMWLDDLAGFLPAGSILTRPTDWGRRGCRGRRSRRGGGRPAAMPFACTPQTLPRPIVLPPTPNYKSPCSALSLPDTCSSKFTDTPT